ncbi:hypothetical protein N7G274_009279 [Stereocaulon virgatum]|uniref:Uncharacterized protein n=1 Tax=Stereocaulon virgatum TaxID=373712 RepID=A0ABR3ZZU0_9LECA
MLGGDPTICMWGCASTTNGMQSSLVMFQSTEAVSYHGIGSASPRANCTATSTSFISIAIRHRFTIDKLLATLLTHDHLWATAIANNFIRLLNRNMEMAQAI